MSIVGVGGSVFTIVENGVNAITEVIDSGGGNFIGPLPYASNTGIGTVGNGTTDIFYISTLIDNYLNNLFSPSAFNSSIVDEVVIDAAARAIFYNISQVRDLLIYVVKDFMMLSEVMR